MPRSNENHVAPQYRKVIPQQSLDTEGHAKSPDYAFRVGQTAKFFAEAKKPGIAIKTASGPAYQLRRYAWSAKLPLRRPTASCTNVRLTRWIESRRRRAARR